MINNENNGTPYGHNNPRQVDLAEVNSYTLEDYGLNIAAVKSNHFGVTVTDPRTGEHLPDQFYNAKLEAAIATAEKMLDIVILPRVVTEHHDFYRNDFESFMHIHTHHKPILQVENVKLEYGGSLVFNYPTKWWRVYNLSGHVEMLPNYMLAGEQGSLNLAQAYSGYPMIAGVPYTVGNNYAPQLFEITYVAGMLPPKRRGVTQPYEMHTDLWNLIVKLALKEVFQQWGRLIIGAGIANMSINIDGVSQSIDTTQSAMYGGASAEIEQLNKDIEGLRVSLKSYYGNNLGLI
jgi:hypothetical protein